MRRPLVLLSMLTLLASGGAPMAGAYHDERDFPEQFGQAFSTHGAFSARLDGIQSQMEFRVRTPTGPIVGGLQLLDGTGMPVFALDFFRDAGGATLGLRTADANVRLESPLEGAASGIHLMGGAECDDGSLWIGASDDSFLIGWSLDAACAIPHDIFALAWVAAQDSDAWAFSIAAPAAVIVDQQIATGRAFYLPADEFESDTRAYARGVGAGLDVIDARAGTVAAMQFEVDHGFVGAFQGWSGTRAGVQASFTNDDGSGACPCEFRESGSAGTWTFQIEGNGAALGDQMLLAGADTAFPAPYL